MRRHEWIAIGIGFGGLVVIWVAALLVFRTGFSDNLLALPTLAVLPTNIAQQPTEVIAHSVTREPTQPSQQSSLRPYQINDVLQANDILDGLVSQPVSRSSADDESLANDLFSDAILIESLPFETSIDTRLATTDPDDPQPSCQPTPPGHSVWYRYDAVDDATIRFATTGSDYNTVLSIWTGAQPETLTEVACNADTNPLIGDVTSMLNLELVSSTYYVLVSTAADDEGGKLILTAQPAQTQSIQEAGQQPDPTDVELAKGIIKDNSQADIVRQGPSVPSLVSPPNQSNTTDSRPTLTWTGIADARAYEVQIDTVNPPQNAAVRTSGASYQPPSALAPGAYYWRVRAVDGNNQVSAWSFAFQIRIKLGDDEVNAVGPEAPKLLIPVDENNAKSGNVTFTWTAVNSAAHYEIQVAPSSAFSTPTLNQTLDKLVYIGCD